MLFASSRLQSAGAAGESVETPQQHLCCNCAGWAGADGDRQRNTELHNTPVRRYAAR